MDAGGSVPGAGVAGPDGRRPVAAALGVCVGLSGIDHGFFEMLQGNTATPGFLIQAIGPAHRMWAYGTEEAITVVPNLMVTGILAMVLGGLTIVWSIRFLDRPNGSLVLLLLGSLSLITGGGIGMVVFLLFGWAVATRIGRPPRRERRPAGRIANAVSTARPFLVGLGLALYAAALEVAVFGFVPGMSDPDRILTVCWGLLVGSLVTFGLALIGSGGEREAIGEIRTPDGATAGSPVLP